MTTQAKIERLKSEGWNVIFNEEKGVHIADRGCMVYKRSNITDLYKSIKNNSYG